MTEVLPAARRSLPCGATHVKRSPRHWTAVVMIALALVPSVGRTDIFMTRGADGTMHFTNVPARRGAGSVVVIRSHDAAPSRAGSQVITADGDPNGEPGPGQSAQVRAMYSATARDDGR